MCIFVTSLHAFFSCIVAGMKWFTGSYITKKYLVYNLSKIQTAEVVEEAVCVPCGDLCQLELLVQALFAETLSCI